MESSDLPFQPSAVLWDFDDTLVDSLPARVHALSRVFREKGIEDVDPQRFLHNLEQTLEQSLIRLAKSLGKTADLFQCYKTIYWTKEPGTLRLYPGVVGVLEALELQGVHLAVVTQKARSFEVEGVAAGASVELEELGVTARFPVVIGLDDVRQPKPHPEGILKALQRLGVPPNLALMIGDTVTDIEAAKAAGCWSCLATWGIPDAVDRKNRANPDLVAQLPSEILRFFQ